MRRILLVSVVFTALSVSCQRAGEDALLIGRLFGDPSIGCVWIGGPEAGSRSIGRCFYDIDVERVRISGPGGFVAEEGDWFRVTGGTRPDTRVTPGCPVRSGRFVLAGIEYFGDMKPSDDLSDI